RPHLEQLQQRSRRWRMLPGRICACIHFDYPLAFPRFFQAILLTCRVRSRTTPEPRRRRREKLRENSCSPLRTAPPSSGSANLLRRVRQSAASNDAMEGISRIASLTPSLQGGVRRLFSGPGQGIGREIAFLNALVGGTAMIEIGMHNPNFGADHFGFRALAALNWNLGAPQLYEHALRSHEAHIAAHGPLVADTGVHTGRSPKDKFAVRDAESAPIVWWENNNAMSVEHFDALIVDFIGHAKGKALFAQDLHGGADPALRVRTRVFTEYAWHSLFIRNLLIRPPAEDLAAFIPDLTIVDLPSFRADPKRHGARSETIIACDFSRRIVLIGGSSYAGEMKKSVFTYLNYVLPP